MGWTKVRGEPFWMSWLILSVNLWLHFPIVLSFLFSSRRQWRSKWCSCLLWELCDLQKFWWPARPTNAYTKKKGECDSIPSFFLRYITSYSKIDVKILYKLIVEDAKLDFPSIPCRMMLMIPREEWSLFVQQLIKLRFVS
jgi:hypothetical protein